LALPFFGAAFLGVALFAVFFLLEAAIPDQSSNVSRTGRKDAPPSSAPRSVRMRTAGPS
jgi:hypothetical protein